MSSLGQRSNRDLPPLKLIDSERSLQKRNEILSSFVKDYFSDQTEPVEILEAGCGRKWHLKLSPLEYHLTGVDISPEALEIRETRVCDIDRSIVGDLGTVEIAESAYDLIYCMNVLEHIDGVEYVLERFFSWLKPGGLSVLVFPDRDSVFGFLARMLPHRLHEIYYKYGLRIPCAGEPGYPPFPTYYDPMISRENIHAFCDRHGHSILLERGRPYDVKKLGALAPFARTTMRLLQWLSIGCLSADHGSLILVIRKGSVPERTVRSSAKLAGENSL